MAVTVGSARSDERGKAHGGAAGDQKNGKEVSTQNWYLHSKGWRVFRAKDSRKALRIAECMKHACASPRIGYDQYERNTLYNAVKDKGFDPRLLDKNVETDCSALVRVCCAYAGIFGLPSNFRTGNMPTNLMKTGEFVELVGDAYTKNSDRLGAGDILVTKTNGHTVVVLTNGGKYEGKVETKAYALGDRTLRNGSEGTDVKELQIDLISLGYSCGSWGADGEFGDSTEIAVRKFQQDTHLECDGIVGKKTVSKLEEKISADAKESENPRTVTIRGGQCWCRTSPLTGDRLGVAHEGESFSYTGIEKDGYLLIEFKGQNGWVNSKYAKVV